MVDIAQGHSQLPGSGTIGPIRLGRLEGPEKLLHHVRIHEAVGERAKRAPGRPRAPSHSAKTEVLAQDHQVQVEEAPKETLNERMGIHRNRLLRVDSILNQALFHESRLLRAPLLG